VKTIITPWRDRLLVIDGEDELPPESLFTKGELAAARGFRLQSRSMQYLWSRFAAKEMAIQRGLASSPLQVTVDRPNLLVNGTPTGWFVSISHSMSLAGAAVSQAPTGLDVQVVRDLPEQASHLFLSDEEIEAMERCSIAHRIIHFWSAKEAAWKQRSSELPTLRQTPLRLVSEQATGLTFDVVETLAIGSIVVAITRR
jgi:4'-phosphopantetheinyl transferase EntD